MKLKTPGTIRSSTDEDKPHIHEIAVAAWQPIFNRYRLIVGDEMWNDVWKGWDEDWFANASGFVTELDGQVAGFATYWEPIKDVLAEVGGNAVHPKFQRRGIGTAQMRYLVDKFREWGYKCTKVLTGVDPAHGPARAEYRKVGFRGGVKHSRYFNYLDEVARVPVRSSLTVRCATPDDATLLCEMTRSAWATVYNSLRGTLGDEIFNIAFRNALEEKVKKVDEVVSDNPEKVRIITEAKQPAGFAILDQNPGKKLGELRSVGVIPDFRGRGIGCALCMDAFQIFRDSGLQYACLPTDLGEVNEQTRQICWNVGLYREIPSVDYYVML